MNGDFHMDFWNGYQQGLNDQNARKDAEKAGEGAGVLIAAAVAAVVLAIVYPVAALIGLAAFAAAGALVTEVTPYLINGSGYTWIGIDPLRMVMSTPGLIIGGIAGLIAAGYGYFLEQRLAENSIYFGIRHVWRVLAFTLASAFALGPALANHYITQMGFFVGIGLSFVLFHCIFWYLVRGDS